MYQAVTEENSRKNLVFGLLQQALPRTEPDNYAWAFDAARTLRVTVIGRLTSSGERATVQVLCDAQFGPGKVVVVT